MTSLVDESTRTVIEGGTVDTLTGTFGLVVVLLLIVLLIERELLRAFNRDAAERAVRLRFVVLPLLAVTVTVIAARFASLAA
jgi:hypothetical protein